MAMERLSAQDRILLWPDDFGWPQDIGALAILDGTRLVDPDGRVRIEAVREAVERHLHLVPRFRQLLYSPRHGLGWPLWVDAPAVDLTDHVQVFPLTASGDEAQLFLAVEHLRRRGLDRSRPLWEMWFLPGLAGGRVALFLKVHHTITDGVAGVALLGAFLDREADAPTPPAPAWTPARMPPGRDVFEDNVRRRIQAAGNALSKFAHPIDSSRQVRRGWLSVRDTFAEARAPRTSLNRRIGSGRRLAIIRSRLDVAKEIAHAHHVKLNDVFMAAVSGGLRDLLRGRGERVEDVVLRAFVPVSLHQEEPGPARGNREGVMIVPLPIGVLDPVRRLQLIAADTVERKKEVFRPPAGMVARNRVIQRAMIRQYARQRLANTYLTNIPGPPMPLYLAGAPLLEMLPIVPLTGNVTLGVGALSYAGQFNVAAVADRDGCPDVDVFAEGMRNALRALASSVPAKPTALGPDEAALGRTARGQTPTTPS
jgi:diacylglycerol O-acyltransferase / wax synthase